MKKKIFTVLGLMSGTSMDGVDLSLIRTDGSDYYEQISDGFYRFSNELFEKLIFLRESIKNTKDLQKKSNLITNIENKFTLFNAKIINDFLKNKNLTPDIIGFHGQTIYHKPNDKISKQIGNADLLSQLTKCTVVNNFRQQDLDNDGQGAPLTPIFHYLISKYINKKKELDYPINIMNIGGITNVTTILNNKNIEKEIFAYDIGPGNCLIDDWIRKNSGKNFDQDGLIARSGKTDDLILNQALENFASKFDYNKSLDIKDFDIFFAKGLSLENGAATITNFTAELIAEGIRHVENKIKTNKSNWLVCGGGRKNKYLRESIEKNFKELVLKPIENYKVNGDFVESQAFAFLAIRSLKNMPISFPNTTRCKKPLTGGILVKNF